MNISNIKNTTSYKSAIMELYNWYIDDLDANPHVCGDVVDVHLRREEYQQDKMNGLTHAQITTKDNIYIKEIQNK